MSNNLTGRVFVVTGGADGIGLSTVKTLLDRGAAVAACDINEKKLSDLPQSLENEEQKSRLLVQKVDVVDRAQVKEFLHAAKTRFGRVDGVANIAGVIGKYFGLKALWELPPEEFDWVMNVNVRGPFNFIAEAMKPGFLEEPASIVNIGSVASCRGYVNGAFYPVSKHAVVGLTKSAAMEGGPRNIRVNAVLPGPTNTDLLNLAHTNYGQVKRPSAYRPFQRLAETSELSSVIVFLLGPESTYVTGAIWAVDGGSLA